MSTIHFLKPALLAAAAAFTLGSAVAADTMTREAVKAEKDRIEAEYKSAKAACDGMKDNAKDVCEKEAKGKEKVAKAELDARNSGKDSDRAKVDKVKAEAEYEVAMERCDDQKGADKNACQAAAKAAQKKAQAAAKPDRKAG